MENLVNLCSSCKDISLSAIIETFPIRTNLKRGFCRPSNFVDSIPQPLVFANVQALSSPCTLCSLISSQLKLAKVLSTSPTRQPLRVAALYPPYSERNMLEPIWSRLDPSTTLGHGELPQTTSLKGKIVVETLGGEIIVNTLEPIPDRFGSEESKRGFGGQSSPWQVNVAADAGA